MKFIADENTDRLIVETLRANGYEVTYIAEVEPSISDEQVFDRAIVRRAVLLTADKDFGELVYRDKRIFADGVILIRLAGLSSSKKAEIVLLMVTEHKDDLAKSFTVITPGNIRFSS